MQSHLPTEDNSSEVWTCWTDRLWNNQRSSPRMNGSYICMTGHKLFGCL